jgi:hypothetical protein
MRWIDLHGSGGIVWRNPDVVGRLNSRPSFIPLQRQIPLPQCVSFDRDENPLDVTIERPHDAVGPLPIAGVDKPARSPAPGSLHTR